MIYYWDSLSCLHHPPLTFSSCRLFPSRSFCLPSLALSHSSIGLVLNPHLSLSITRFISPFAVHYQWDKKRYEEKERRASKKSTFPHSCPFSVEENCLGFKWRYSSASVPVLTTELVCKRPMPRFCLSISELKSLFHRIGWKTWC